MSLRRPADFSDAYQHCHIFVIFSLPFPLSTLFRHTLASSVAESMRLAVCWVGSGERRREGGIERKAQKEEGGRELSNRIKGEQRNGEHLKYSWHEPSCKKEGMSNNGWITLESRHNMLSVLLALSLYCPLCLSFTFLLSSLLSLSFTYWPRYLMDLRGAILIMWDGVALINQWKKGYSIQMEWQKLPPVYSVSLG